MKLKLKVNTNNCFKTSSNKLNRDSLLYFWNYKNRHFIENLRKLPAENKRLIYEALKGLSLAMSSNDPLDPTGTSYKAIGTSYKATGTSYKPTKMIYNTDKHCANEIPLCK